MSPRDHGPRPRSHAATAALVGELRELLEAARSIDPYNHVFAALLRADVAHRTAAHTVDEQDDTPDADDLPPASGAGFSPGLALVVALTLLGDIGTLFVSVSIVLSAAVWASVLIAVALGVAAMFLAHECGRWLGRRALARSRAHGALVAGCALAWLAIGAVAALLRLAAPPAVAGGFGAAGSSQAVPVVLALVLFVLYLGNGLAATMLGLRTAGREPVDWERRLAGRTRRRRRIALLREQAWTASLEAETALRIAAAHGNPMSTDVVLATTTEEGHR